MTEVNLQSILDKTVVIPATRQYWLVRTMGGDYYSECHSNNFIAIGYDLITLKDIWTAKKQGPNAQKHLIEVIKKRYEKTDKGKEINATYAAAQLLRFCSEIKKGDIVIVPGRSHEKRIAIGEVKGLPYEELHLQNNAPTDCPFSKRIKVDWYKEYYRNTLNPRLQLIFNSRHIISSINDYAQYIDSTVFNFYKKDNKTYLVLSVKTHRDILGSDFMFIGDVLSLLTGYVERNNIPVNIDDIRMKVCVQSPGDIIMFATSAEGICLCGLIILLLNGGKFQLQRCGLELSTKGIFQQLSEFLDRRQDRKQTEALCKKLDNMQIENPGDLLKALEQLKNPRDKY